MRSANLPEAHRLDVRSTAAPVLRSAVIILASSTSLIWEVGSSNSRIEPIMLFRTASLALESEDDDGWASLPEINCASTFVSRTRDQSEGDSG
eukprot:CAMPEP_0196253816 /NCGR_PEP_ID=MMETSP0913-20130531/52585_1 /TAXON_ID=49265 /ORGANISM="Thalassiosira rotula, Strain GSO102" /LENGTH=92 /DNA_ID=CAMNT_0041540909 /DNA_START=368 /DNA_END=646 /DNA_ORIENTATION=+